MIDPGAPVREKVWTRVEDQSWTRLAMSVYTGLCAEKWSVPRTQVMTRVQNPVERQVMRQARASVFEQLLEDLKK